MKTAHSALGFSLALCLGAAVAMQAAETHWVSLFNGKDLTGWTPVNQATFDVHDGNLRVVKGTGWLRSNKSYRNFRLEFEWRGLDRKYDSGLYFRSGLAGKPWPKDGWQMDIRYDAACGLLEGYRPVIPSQLDGRIPVNHWCKVRLEVRGKQATLWVNGEESWKTKVIDSPEGYIGLQAENTQCEFRHLRIQELPSDAEASTR